jgi:hypothetical protein
MNYSLIAVFCALLANFAIIVSLFFIPLLRKGFFIWIGAFFVLGLALAVMAVKQKVEGKLKFFLILTGASAAAFVASVLLHNFIYGLFIFLLGPDFWVKIGLKDEPVFFFIAVLVCPIAFLVGAVGSIVLLIKRRG